MQQYLSHRDILVRSRSILPFNSIELDGKTLEIVYVFQGSVNSALQRIAQVNNSPLTVVVYLFISLFVCSSC